jgi:hypothetical protein
VMQAAGTKEAAAGLHSREEHILHRKPRACPPSGVEEVCGSGGGVREEERDGSSWGADSLGMRVRRGRCILQ